MNKKESNGLLTKEQKKEIEKLVELITNEAKLVVEDYVKNPVETSGSIIQIHENSPILKD